MFAHSFFFFNDTATTEIYTLSLHDALPIFDRNGVRRIILVPLLISSFSEHYEEVRYFAGLRPDRPAVLEHADDPPLETKARLIITKAMDSHPLVTRILIDQARAAAGDAASESLVLVAHGPTEDPD